MPPAIDRRQALAGALAVLAAPGALAAPDPDAVDARLAEIEAAAKGRLGVAIIDTKTGTLYGHNDLDRFALCSTFKVLAAAMLLNRVDLGEEKLHRRIAFGKDEVVPYSPVTEPQAGGAGLTLAELCAAAITRSDNTAANLLLKALGGPQALTQFLRTLGDKTTRIDRSEPALNDVPKGDFRDGTTPRAMAYTLQRILLGNVLTKASERQLVEWLVANTTGDARLRAGLPPGWRVGDKTGTCNSTVADVAIAWPPGHPPLIIAAYLAASPLPPAAREAALADVGRLAASLV